MEGMPTMLKQQWADGLQQELCIVARIKSWQWEIARHGLEVNCNVVHK
jgi:hypothetical protein